MFTHMYPHKSLYGEVSICSHQTDSTWTFWVWLGDLQVVRWLRCLSWHWMSLLRLDVVRQHSLSSYSSRVGLWSEYVTHSYPHKPRRKINWPSVVTRLTAHVTCGLMSDLIFCKHRKEYNYTWHRMSLLRLGVIKQHKPNLFFYVYIWGVALYILIRISHSGVLIWNGIV